MSLRRFNPSPSIPLPGRIKISVHRQGYSTIGARCAFSLIELVLVLIIISITALLAAPRYANFLAEQRATSAANRIATDLTMAQRRAKFSSTTQSFDFDLLGDFYSIGGMQDPDHPANPYVVNLIDEPYLAEIVSVDFGGDAKLIFDGYGVPDTAGSVVIRSGTREKEILLKAQTGRVVVLDYSPGPPQLPE